MNGPLFLSPDDPRGANQKRSPAQNNAVCVSPAGRNNADLLSVTLRNARSADATEIFPGKEIRNRRMVSESVTLILRLNENDSLTRMTVGAPV